MKGRNKVEIINPKREYVIVCNRHTSIINNSLLFWGELTPDNDERSFGGYTCDFNKCERYTEDEIRNHSATNPDWMSFFNKTAQRRKSDTKLRQLREYDDVAISITELKELGFKEYTVMV